MNNREGNKYENIIEELIMKKHSFYNRFSIPPNIVYVSNNIYNWLLTQTKHVSANYVSYNELNYSILGMEIVVVIKYKSDKYLEVSYVDKV